MKTPYKLTPSEVEILKEGATNPSLVTDYFFAPYGTNKGWVFDENFDETGAWQNDVCLAKQSDIVVIGGFGTGKTSGVAMMACYLAIMLPWFKFLNAGPTSFQAKQMYDFIIRAASGTPFEKLIWEKPRRPYHKLVIKFMIEETVYESTLEFMSADQDGTGILSWEGDWINIEEAGLLDNLEEVVMTTGSRLRGTVRGRPRLGRLSMISNSWDNAYMWYYFDQAAKEPDVYLSIIVPTTSNKNITPEQLDRLAKRVPEAEREQFLNGARPVGKGKYFDKDGIYGCEDELASDTILQNALNGVEEYHVETLYGVGVVGFETPVKNDGLYIVVGDPGIDGAPKRNAPAIFVYEIPPDFPLRPARMVAMWWGDGQGKISPFVNKLLYFKKKYNAIICAVDSTASQKNMAEIINLQYLGIGAEDTSPTVGVIGLDFSGTKKAGYLIVLRMFLENRLMTWPKFVIGMRSQLSNYDPERDKKLAQDLVASSAMVAWVVRSYFNVDLDEVQRKRNNVVAEDVPLEKRLPQSARERRSATRERVAA